MTGSPLLARQQPGHPALLSEPVVIAEWWKNRGGDSVRLTLTAFKGRNVLDLRTWYTADGKLMPGKGFTAEVRHLPRLAAAVTKAEAAARQRGLIVEKVTEGD